MFEQGLRFDEERSPCGRQCHRTGAAGEQRDAQVVFEQLDLPAQRWLGHVQAFGSAAEIQFGRHRGEAAQLGQFEH
ncbi:hypothetical protein D9M68_647370 [compost metagenome]